MHLLEQAALELLAQDATHGPVQPLLGDLAARNRLAHTADRDGEVRRHEHLVGAGEDRLDRDAVIAEQRAHSVHGEGVGHDHALEAELLAQQAR